MALSNRELVGRMIEEFPEPMYEFLDAVLGPNWIEIVRQKDLKDGNAGKVYEPKDLQEQVKVIAMRAGAVAKVAGHSAVAHASEIREVRNRWAHMAAFTTPDALRALDTGARLLTAIGAKAAAGRVQRMHDDLNRRAVQVADQKVLAQAGNAPASQGLKPWREVLRPHDDVATGNFRSSEFAADLHKVAVDPALVPDYAEPSAFFARTYLTEGLRDLIGSAVRRLTGDANSAPVINLQTNFGGGKTHSMLALWHVAAGESLDSFPQDVQLLLAESGYQQSGAPVAARRAALVGNHIAPEGSIKEDGTKINTLWGELAWQLGGRAAYDLVADADRSGTAPGQALHTLLARYSPAVILVDEWVAYARQLFDRDNLAGGTFDTQFTFAQSLTEVAKATPGILLAISIPASHDGDDRAAGHNEEVGGQHGQEALKRLQNVVRRVADQWRPASAEESYHIVRQRLFQQPDADAQAAIGATARAFVDFYTHHGADFPKEARDLKYEDRIRQTYPIHPEVFDRLYEDWSTLERFQRTRGVLRLMNAVIHALWTSGDQAPMILPGSVPLYDNVVNSELTQYLPDSWKGVIDADVDGQGSEPWKIDAEKPLFGARQVTKRLARAVFFGAAPTIGTAQKGLDTQRLFLGVATPGDTPGNFHSALSNLADRATHFYSTQGRHWYDLQANITRRAKDQAERLHPEDVWAEIVRRLAAAERGAGGAFARVHVCPEDSSDVIDADEARLVIVHPRHTHKKGVAESSAVGFAMKTTTTHGSGMRTHRNMLVYLAADESAMESLEASVRDYLGWSYVLDHAADLDLTHNQRQQAVDKRALADSTVTDRLRLAYVWALVPEQADGGKPFTVTTLRADGGAAATLTERVAKKLGTEDLLRTRQAAAAVRMQLDQLPQLWESGHVRAGDLWELYARYPYMPRLRDRSVLLDGLADVTTLAWERDAFALADGVDGSGRYIGLSLPSDPGTPHVTAATLLVKPEVALAQRLRELPPAPEQALASEAAGAGVSPAGGPAPTPAPPVRTVTRFFAAKTLNPGNSALDYAQLSREVLSHLVGDTGTNVRIRVEIEAERPAGFDEATIRTVSENAATLKCDQAGFEES